MKIFETLEKSEILRPSILLALGTLIFLAISAYAPSFGALAVIALSLGAFAFGEKIGITKWKLKAKKQFDSRLLKSISFIVFLVSLACLYLDFFTAGGVPLLDSSIRRFLNPILTSLAFLMVPANAVLISTLANEKKAKLRAVLMIVFTAGSMALLGYRTEVLAALISGTITAYYCGIFKAREIAALAIGALVAFGGMTVIRGNGFESYRAATTVAAFDFLADETPALGMTHGSVQFADFVRLLSGTPMVSGRHLVAKIIGGRAGVSITSTLFGPVFADFGWLGIFEFAIFGILAGACYKAAVKNKGIYAAAHSIVLTFILLGIETGITDLVVWAYLLAAGALFAYSYFKK